MSEKRLIDLDGMRDAFEASMRRCRGCTGALPDLQMCARCKSTPENFFAGLSLPTNPEPLWVAGDEVFILVEGEAVPAQIIAEGKVSKVNISYCYQVAGDQPHGYTGESHESSFFATPQEAEETLR